MGLMRFLEKLFVKPQPVSNVIKIYYRCHKCKHAFELILRKSYDIQSTYGEDRECQEAQYLYQKELRDSKCFNTIRLKIYFNQRYNILQHEIQGGELISEEDFLAQTASE